MVDNVIGILFSGLLGLVLIVAVGLLARRAMLKDLGKDEAPKSKEGGTTGGDAELSGSPGSQDPS